MDTQQQPPTPPKLPIVFICILTISVIWASFTIVNFLQTSITQFFNRQPAIDSFSDSQGSETTGTGNENSPFGNSNTGLSGGIGDISASHDLYGRSVIGEGLPLPENRIAETGIIVIEIAVNPQGDVIHAEIRDGGGTNIDNTDMINSALQAVTRAKFNSIQETSVYIGTITYQYGTQNLGPPPPKNSYSFVTIIFIIIVSVLALQRFSKKKQKK